MVDAKMTQTTSTLDQLFPLGLVLAYCCPWLGRRLPRVALVVVSLIVGAFDLVGLCFTGERRYVLYGSATFFLMLVGQFAIETGWQCVRAEYDSITELFGDVEGVRRFDSFIASAMRQRRQLAIAAGVSVVWTGFFIWASRVPPTTLITAMPICLVVFLVAGNGIYFAAITPGLVRTLSGADLKLDYVSPGNAPGIRSMCRLYSRFALLSSLACITAIILLFSTNVAHRELRGVQWASIAVTGIFWVIILRLFIVPQMRLQQIVVSAAIRNKRDVSDRISRAVADGNAETVQALADVYALMEQAKPDIFTLGNVGRYTLSFVGPLAVAIFQTEYVNEAIGRVIQSWL